MGELVSNEDRVPVLPLCSVLSDSCDAQRLYLQAPVHRVSKARILRGRHFLLQQIFSHSGIEPSFLTSLALPGSTVLPGKSHIPV